MSTSLSKAVVKTLLQSTAVTSLVGSDDEWGPYIWADSPQARIENTGMSAIVVTEVGPWTDKNQHNTAEFPTLYLDIWADPDRNPDRSVKRYNADGKIKDITAACDSVLHMVNNGVSPSDPSWWGAVGMTRVFGDADEIANRTGLFVINCVHTLGPNFSDITNDPGGRMGQVTYNLQLP